MSDKQEITTPVDIKKKEEKVQCIACADDIDKGHFGIKCAQNHSMCHDCGEQWITSHSNEGWITFPPKCPTCRVDFSLDVIERNITQPEQLTMFLSKSLSSVIPLLENEFWSECPACPYKEIRETSNPPMMIYCQNTTCNKIHCFFCLRCTTQDDIARFEAEYDSDGQGEIGLVSDESDPTYHILRKHFKCAEFGPSKKKLETALRIGIEKSCPSCGLKGRKDDNCTHMTCSRCSKNWCYVCGIEEDKLDKAKNKQDIYGHNMNWVTKPGKRCPMYLSQIFDVDVIWPQSDEEALDYYHHLLTLRSLRATATEIGQESMNHVLELFPSVLGGYRLEDVMAFDPMKPLFTAEVTDEFEEEMED